MFGEGYGDGGAGTATRAQALEKEVFVHPHQHIAQVEDVNQRHDSLLPGAGAEPCPAWRGIGRRPSP
jgi:hypothetical protein